MLDAHELEKLAKMIPANARYAVIASWPDREETAEEWDDFDHVHYTNNYVDACNTKRQVEDGYEPLIAYIIEPLS